MAESGLARIPLPGLSFRTPAILDRAQGTMRRRAPPCRGSLLWRNGELRRSIQRERAFDSGDRVRRQLAWASQRRSKGRLSIFGSRCLGHRRRSISGRAFLSLGGNSLMAVQLISRVRDVFEVELASGRVSSDLRRSSPWRKLSRFSRLNSDEIPGVEDLLSEIESLGIDEARALLAKEIEVPQPEGATKLADGTGCSRIPTSVGSSSAFSFFRAMSPRSRPTNTSSCSKRQSSRIVMTLPRFGRQSVIFTASGAFIRTPRCSAPPLPRSPRGFKFAPEVSLRPCRVQCGLLRNGRWWTIFHRVGPGSRLPPVFILWTSCFHRSDLSERSKLTADVVEAVRRYWRGEPARGPTGTGEEAVRSLYPRPVQPELPTWLTATRSTETFILAGRMGVNVLTALLRISKDEMAEKIAAYRKARRDYGHDPDTGKVTLMLHAFVGSDDEEVRRTVSEPFREYLRSHLEFLNSDRGPTLAIRGREPSLPGVQSVL